jgi:hypothetical protein
MSKQRGTFTLIARAAVPDLGMRPDDILSIEPGAPEPVMLHRELPEDRSAIADALESGALESLLPECASQIDAYLAGRPVRYGRLELVKGGAP